MAHGGYLWYFAMAQPLWLEEGSFDSGLNTDNVAQTAYLLMTAGCERRCQDRGHSDDNGNKKLRFYEHDEEGLWWIDQ